MTYNPHKSSYGAKLVKLIYENTREAYEEGLMDGFYGNACQTSGSATYLQGYHDARRKISEGQKPPQIEWP
jgi:hypothetical protein